MGCIHYGRHLFRCQPLLSDYAFPVVFAYLAIDQRRLNFSSPTTFTYTMHLLNTSTRKVQEFSHGRIPPYVILSHRWEDKEISYKDLTEPKQDPSKLKGWTKLNSFCSLVRQDGWEWAWMDTCCIDRSSSAELSEAINSMYQWYGQAEFCIAYLADISIMKDETGIERKRFCESEWFKRGWTLQELLASHEVVFCDRSWKAIGTRTRLSAYVSRATHISVHHLSRPSEASVAAKMSWASNRQTSRPEDIAYSLLGLFDVNMPLLYGEGGFKAFQRLQYEIVRSRRDESIFAWSRPGITTGYSSYLYTPPPGLLAPSPKYFSESGDIVPIDPIHFERVNLHAPQILFDGLVWTLQRSFIEDKDREKRKMVTRVETPYVAPLACAKVSAMHAPVKLQMMMSPNSLPHRGPFTSLEFFSESEIQQLENSGAREYRLIQEQPRRHGSAFTNNFRPGFTLRLSKSAQHQCSRPSEFGQGVELQTSPEPDGYLVSTSEELQDSAGIVMQHKMGAVIQVACDSVSSSNWRLVMSVNTQIFVIYFDRFGILSEHDSINLGDSAIVSLEQGQNISISPKHGQRAGQNEVVVYIDCNVEDHVDLPNIFSDDSIGETSEDLIGEPSDDAHDL